MERSNPLPIGRYWIQLPLEHSIAFAYFLRQKDFVVKEREARNEDDDWTLYVFRVIRPVQWQAEIFGWPNHADGSSIETWMPPPPPGTVRRKERWKLAETLVVGIGTIVIAGLIVNKWGNTKVRASKGDEA